MKSNMKSRLLAGAVCAASLVLVGPVGVAAADKPSGGCPSDKWQESVFPLNWQPGDSMDPTGQNLLLQLGIAGTIEEFGSLEAGLAAFGFATFTQFYAAAVDPAYNLKDKNNDGILCFKLFPSQSNVAAYLANTVDNTAHPN